MAKELAHRAAVPDVWLLGAIEIEVVQPQAAGGLMAPSRWSPAVSSQSAVQRLIDSIHLQTTVSWCTCMGLLISVVTRYYVTRSHRGAASPGNWHWRLAPYQVEIKRLFAGRSLHENLRDIASYVARREATIPFGTTRASAASALMTWTQRFRTGNVEPDGADHRRAGSHARKIAVLDGAWLRLMRRSRDMRICRYRSPRTESL